MNDTSKGPLSFLFVIPIKDGKGEWPFPSQLRENLFQNFVKVKGLYSSKDYKEKYLFTTSNASEHGIGKKVITNVLGVFNFPKPNHFQLNGTTVSAPINSIPSDLKFFVTDQSFKLVNDFNGWIWVELDGHVKDHVE